MAQNTKLYAEAKNFTENPFIKNPDPDENVFRHNIVFGAVPIGNPADISINLADHIMDADIILVESHREFSRLITRVNSLTTRFRFDLQPGAVIYQYQLESPLEKIKEINNILIDEARRGKKILIVSDEGSSVFLEPGVMFKSEVIKNNLPYQVLAGPNAGISSVTNSNFIIREFIFGESLPSISHEKRMTLFEKINLIRIPVVFLLTAVDSKECIESMIGYFDNDQWQLDFAISLSMKDETHIYGSVSDILKYIDNNDEIFLFDNQDKKFAVVLYPVKNKS